MGLIIVTIEQGTLSIMALSNNQKHLLLCIAKVLTWALTHGQVVIKLSIPLRFGSALPNFLSCLLLKAWWLVDTTLRLSVGSSSSLAPSCLNSSRLRK